jgi:hypothetical protein
MLRNVAEGLPSGHTLREWGTLWKGWVRSPASESKSNLLPAPESRPSATVPSPRSRPWWWQQWLALAIFR